MLIILLTKLEMSDWISAENTQKPLNIGKTHAKSGHINFFLWNDDSNFKIGKQKLKYSCQEIAQFLKAYDQNLLNHLEIVSLCFM